MGWNDECIPKIRVVMQGYLAQPNGRVHLAEILTAAGCHQMDLPTLPKYVHATGAVPSRPYVDKEGSYINVWPAS